MKLITAFSLISAASAAVTSLKTATYAEQTAGKTVFIKFFAPWCGHCKSMAGDWETLAGEWEGHEVGLVAEVDCTEEDSKALCEANGVQGFPTIKFGDPNALEDYQGGRDLSDFTSFATENLKPVCSLNNIDLCSDEKKAKIAELQGKSEEDLQGIIDGLKKVEEEADAHLEAEVGKLQAKYEELMAEKEAKIKAAKDESQAGLAKAVLKSKQDAAGAGEGEL